VPFTQSSCWSGRHPRGVGPRLPINIAAVVLITARASRESDIHTVLTVLYIPSTVTFSFIPVDSSYHRKFLPANPQATRTRCPPPVRHAVSSLVRPLFELPMSCIISTLPRTEAFWFQKNPCCFAPRQLPKEPHALMKASTQPLPEVRL
jgi:hypothetical protein